MQGRSTLSILDDAMSYVAIVSWGDNNRVAKYAEFPVEAEAVSHVVKHGGFAAPHPGVGSGSWLVDPVTKTLSVSPPVAAKPTKILYEAFQSRFTQTEFDATVEFLFEIDSVRGKPKRPRLIQTFNQVVAKNGIHLLAVEIDAFMTALVNGGVITAQRKTEILTP